MKVWRAKKKGIEILRGNPSDSYREFEVPVYFGANKSRNNYKVVQIRRRLISLRICFDIGIYQGLGILQANNDS